jgi:hypothetical protein
MPNFESCELGRAGLDALSSGRIDLLARRLGVGAEGAPPDDDQLKKVSQDFAAVFYSIAFKEMQQSTRLSDGEDSDVDEEEDGPVTQGAQDFVGMFLPQAIAADPADPLARYIYQSLKDYYGGALDEKA